ncbi:response regulator transcription factor [Thioalbus denitrificans]|uniref:LuxR family two component transcriptional regulator n=1 Tax=Thioalbus denitrificans TaxID=547122 RepID=A0A369BWJ8_9GAMM|nr:response regulator transcription factor [Thioalbus denitrificans]RCX26062.1 LuxR family two component transcriptional regulator [Thioalbus denitrificans]
MEYDFTMKKSASRSSPGPSRILLIDDHPLVRAGLRALIDHEHDLAVCGEAAGSGEALKLADDLAPDVAIVDLSLTEGSGLELIKRLHARHPATLLLVCSMHDESLFAERALKAGARGYINKQEATNNVVDAVHRVLEGGIYLSATMTQRMRQAGNAGRQASVGDLTDRELEVFGLIGEGLATSRIAEQLHLSIKTVESHREKIKKKLNLATGSELARYAVQWTLEHD